MDVRSVAAVLIGLVLIAAPALAQTQPARGNDYPAVGAPEPDQPVRPQMPVLERRADQQPTAQQAPQPPRPPFTLTPQEQAEVDHVLDLWEQRNNKIKTFDCEFTRWTYDAVFGRPNEPKFVDMGILRYEAPARGMFRVERTEQGGRSVPIDNARAEHWICDSQSVFEYSHVKKQLIEHKLPPELQGKAIVDSPLPFLFTSSAEKLKQRYWIKVVPLPDVKDQIWLLAYPRFQQEARNFHCAEFVLQRDGMSPFAMNLVQRNGKDRIAYQFSNVVINDPLRLFKGNPFQAKMPLGWQKIVEDSAAEQATRVPNGGPR
jgi:TIGR03009 family protein